MQLGSSISPDIAQEQEITNYKFRMQLRLARYKRELIKRHTMLSLEEAYRKLGSRKLESYETALREGELLVLDYSAKVLVPDFQIDKKSNTTKPIIRQLMQLFREARSGPMSGDTSLTQEYQLRNWELFIWLDTQCEILEFKSPIQLLDATPHRVIQAAKRELEPLEF